MAFNEWLASTFGTTFVLGTLGFLARNWIIERLKNSIKLEYDKELETHKNNLNHTSELAITKLTAELESKASEQNIKLTRVFEDQAEVIAQIYSNFVALINSIQEYTTAFEGAGTPSKTDRRNKVAEDLDVLLRHYKPNRIYIPFDSQKKIEALIETLFQTSHQYTFEVVYHMETNKRMPDFDTFMKASKFLQGDCVQLLKDLDADFKKVLGMR
jgi:hypothetical protein